MGEYDILMPNRTDPIELIWPCRRSWLTACAAPAQQPLELSLVSEVVLERYCLLFGLLDPLNDGINGIAKEARRRQ